MKENRNIGKDFELLSQNMPWLFQTNPLVAIAIQRIINHFSTAIGDIESQQIQVMKLRSQFLAIDDGINLHIQEYNDLVNKPISIELYLDRLAKVREDLNYCVKQLILSFLRTYPKRSGHTYKEICRHLRSEINTSYLNLKELVEGGLILEKKEKGKKERYVIHPTHLKDLKGRKNAIKSKKVKVDSRKGVTL